MSKKNSNVILKENFNNDKELSGIYLNFKKKLNKLKKKPILIAVSGGPDSLALSALAKLYSLEKNCSILIDIRSQEDISIISRCMFLRPIIFNYKDDFYDVYHA